MSSFNTFQFFQIKILDAVSTGVENEVATELIEVTVGAGEKLEVEYKIRHPNSKLR